MPEKKIILMGYSFFDKYYLNPSEEIAKLLDGQSIEEFSIKGIVLPVSVEKVKKEVPRILMSENASIVLGLGLSPIIDKPVIELSFVNLLYFTRPDIDGMTYKFESIVENAPMVLSTNLPFKEICEECEHKGIGVRPGVGIGTYLCNMLGYLIAYFARTKKFIGGFIHIPPHTDLAMRIGLPVSVSLHEILDSIKCVLRATVKYVKRYG
ncbi:hypothetical protein J4526_03165 [Desulfurococcaceae archaeon MEX13E-LK6-19]|nr:hypothetical protein J4526_03165 [Desulfurococcaceae archaeon MEX13E-LK6-19]